MLSVEDEVLLRGRHSLQYGKPYKPRKRVTNNALALKRKKEAARHRVKYALRTGRLFKEACQIAFCGRQESEAHHPDYDYPLDVLWFCHRHHEELHGYLNRL